MSSVEVTQGALDQGPACGFMLWYRSLEVLTKVVSNSCTFPFASGPAHFRVGRSWSEGAWGCEMFGAKTGTLSDQLTWRAGPGPGRKRVNLEGHLVALFPSPWPLHRRHLAEGLLRARVWMMSTARFGVSAQRHRLDGSTEAAPCRAGWGVWGHSWISSGWRS